MAQASSSPSQEETSEERDLVLRARAGDPTAFDAIVRRFDRAVTALAARLLDDPDDADDLRQLAWLRAWRALPSFDQRSRLSTWLFAIVVNLARDRLRAESRERTIRLEPGQERGLLARDAAPEDALAAREIEARVRDALRSLPAEERECLVLRHYHELSVSEIGVVVGRPRTTVQSALARALARLEIRLRPLLSREPIPKPVASVLPMRDPCQSLRKGES